jgi:acetylornithine deacetylase/succinyl-diaminopimelate desuccinylase-like protein
LTGIAGEIIIDSGQPPEIYLINQTEVNFIMSNVQKYIDQNSDRFREELFDLLRIPSVSTDSSHKGDVRRAAEFLRDNLQSFGMDKVELHETPGNPILYAEHAEAGADAPVVLIYGHYDVQPPDPLNLWKTPPFEPVVRDGAVYARGASDDKGQAFTHVKSLEAWLKSGEKLPVNVKMLLEGEEEIGSPNLIPFIEKNRDMLACDMVLISDTAMFAKDTPSITYGLRGLAYMEVDVTGPNRDLHSGVYGGAIKNPLNALCEIMARLIDENGRVTVPGFYDDVLDLSPEEKQAYARLPFDEEKFKKELEIDAVAGEKGYSTLERRSARPSLDMNGMWGGYQGEGAKTVLPARAGCKVSMRLVPNQDHKKIAKLFTDYIHQIKPEGVTVEVRDHHGGEAALTDLNFYGMQAASEAFERVYGRKPLFSREGGSIPIVAGFERVLGVNSILMGFGLNSDAIHSPNERFSLEDFHRGIKTSAQFFEVLPKHKKS